MTIVVRARRLLGEFRGLWRNLAADRVAHLARGL
jgi:hypothetical protein